MTMRPNPWIAAADIACWYWGFRAWPNGRTHRRMS